MAISTVQASYQMQANATLDGVGLSGTIQIGPGATPFSLAGVDVAYALRFEIADLVTTTLDLETGAVTGATSGTIQVETATVVAAAGATSNGNLAVTLTMAGVTYPIVVPLNTTDHTTAALVAGAIRDAIDQTQGDTVTAVFPVGGSGADVTLTRATPAANDATLNIAITAGLGVSAIVNSTNTTAGVQPTKIYRIDGQTYDTEDFQGKALPNVTDVKGFLVVLESGDLEISATSSVTDFMSGSEILLKMNSAGMNALSLETVTFGGASPCVFNLYVLGTA